MIKRLYWFIFVFILVGFSILGSSVKYMLIEKSTCTLTWFGIGIGLLVSARYLETIRREERERERDDELELKLEQKRQQKEEKEMGQAACNK